MNRSVLVMLLVAMLAGGLVGVGSSRPANAARVPLRQVDWMTVLKADPAITIDPGAFKLPGGNWPFVSVAAPDSMDGTLSGYALTEDVVYGDFDSDGTEEALIPVASGGTGGLLGFLLYREADPAPKLTLVGTGYKMGFSAEGNRLAITQPHYVGFEANCCPSASVKTLNVLDGDRLVTLTTEVEPYEEAREPTVRAFYGALSERRYEEAYAFYSPAFQASNPYDAWRAGYANTQDITVETSPGRTPNEVQIELTATDRQPGGGTVTRRFTGTWTLVWSADQKRWLLDTGSIQPA